MSIEGLKPFRDQIDAIDDEILSLMKKRFDVVKEVIVYKTDHGIAASLQDRVDAVHDRNVLRAVALDLPQDFISGLYSYIIDYTCTHEAVRIPHDDNENERKPTKAA